MILIYGECGRQTRVAQRLYRQSSPEEPHLSRQVIEKTMKRFRETDSVTYKSQICRRRRVGQRVQPEDVLAYTLVHPQSSTREIIELSDLTKSHIWIISNEVGAHPYRPGRDVRGCLEVQLFLQHHHEPLTDAANVSCRHHVHE